jgi:hypothetical protein
MESMEHILIECNTPPPRIIWNLAREIWLKDTYKWLDINLGFILGCGSITSPRTIVNPKMRQAEQDNRTHTAKGLTHLLQIITTESTHLIWVLCCERVIRDQIHPEREIKAWWQAAINARLTDDKITATKIKREEKFKHLVRAAWKPPL